MTTVLSTDKPNSLEQDKAVNPEQTQFTSTEGEEHKQPATSFVSQFDTQAASKKKPNRTMSNSAPPMFMCTMVNLKRLKALT